MPRKNIFEEPFDEGTLDKLSIYKEYLKEWLPVFVAKPKPIWKTVQIFDLFAGEGQDKDGASGSPLIAIEVINQYKELAIANGVKIILHLNELKKTAFQILKKNVLGLDVGFDIRVYNEKFETLFESLCLSMKDSANFLFLDQNGIKEITPALFTRITTLNQTDLLFFISSSYFKRFSVTPEFRKYFPFDKEEIKEIDHYHIHRLVLEHYKSIVNKATPYFLAPFSIKKNANIYGLIFGTNHSLGIEKFLKVSWKKDVLTGEANFNIDSENIDPRKPSLFPDFDKPDKRQLFEKNLTNLILNKNLVRRYDIYLYGLTEGFQMKDVNVVLRNLRSEDKIYFSFDLISSNLHKHKDQESLKVL
jgi:three-Cys-motif partner protein